MMDIEGTSDIYVIGYKKQKEKQKQLYILYTELVLILSIRCFTFKITSTKSFINHQNL